MSHRIEVRTDDDQGFAAQIKRHEKIAHHAVREIPCLMRDFFTHIAQLENAETFAQQLTGIRQITERLTLRNFHRKLFDSDKRILSQKLKDLPESTRGRVQGPAQNETYQNLLNKIMEQESILIRHRVLQKLSSLFPTDELLEPSPSRSLSVITEDEQKIANDADSNSFAKINQSLQEMKSSYRVLENIEAIEMVITSGASILGLIASLSLWKDSSSEFEKEKTATSIASFTIIFCLCMLKCGSRRSLSSLLSSSIFCHRDEDAKRTISTASDKLLESVKELVAASEAVAQVANDARHNTQRPSN